MAFVVRIFVCIALSGIMLYAYVDKHNALTALRLKLPLCVRQERLVEEENVRLQFAIEKFENPLHLMELARKPEFSHLKHPWTEDIICVEVPDESD